MKKSMLEEFKIIDKYGMTSKQLRESRQYEGAGFPEKLKSGLYLIGYVLMNPFTKEEFYWLKVGVSVDLASRMEQYQVSCPMVWKNSYCYRKNMKHARKEETMCHNLLEKLCIEKGFRSKEWFRVEREVYLDVCQKGFSFFGLKSDA